MTERVSAIQGNIPIILVCPHGPDDKYTDFIAESVAEKTKCYAVINRGFERSDEVDVFKDKANCNRIDHVLQDIVRDEFLEPILLFQELILDEHDEILILHLHGFGDQVEKKANKEIDMIIGYGAGQYPSYTCEFDHINLLAESWLGEVFLGKAGGKYAARNSNNLNQYFRLEEYDQDVFSMQIEISRRFRTDKKAAKGFIETFSDTVCDLEGFTGLTDPESPLLDMESI